jgi:hypothetical protein
MVFKCLREESIYNVGASLYRLASSRCNERRDRASGSLVLTDTNIPHCVTEICDGYEEKQITCWWSDAASSLYRASLT